jgi:hypothetical protein
LDKICYSQQYGASIEDKKKIITYVVKKYYNNLIGYKYCDNPENIKKGQYVKYISNDMKKINYGLIINVTRMYNENVTFTIKSTFNNSYWKIDPYKYYIFHKKCKSKNAKKTSKLIKEYIDIYNKK